VRLCVLCALLDVITLVQQMAEAVVCLLVKCVYVGGESNQRVCVGVCVCVCVCVVLSVQHCRAA